MKKEFYTIKEVAEQLNITPQAVYKKLTTVYKPYVKELNGKKFIKSSFFEEFYKKNLNKVEQHFDNFVQQNSTVEQLLKDRETEILELKKEINRLNQKLDDERLRYHELSMKIGESLNTLTQSDLGKTLIQAKEKDTLLITDDNSKENKKWWKFWN